VCDVNLEADFLDAYNAGYHLYSLRSNVNRATSSINAKENELERIEKKMREKEALLIAKETATEDRVLLLADLKDMSERTGELEEQIRDLYEQRARYQVELEQYQVAVLDYGY
jgi:predicted  nucleic acid-binding Zn-ribbon protein